MKTHGLALPRNVTFALWLALLFTAGNSEAAFYQVGQIVTNFVVYARTSTTNALGYGEDAPMRLQDFGGKIIFVEFFDPT